VTVLVETRDGDLRRLLPAEHDLPGWHARLTAEISAHLSPAHAAILAIPRPLPDGISWETNAAATRRYSQLAAADRDALTRALGTILSRIRRLAESGAAPAVSTAWPMLREIPDLTMVFAADGAPVIAGWGHVSAAARARGLLAEFDDGGRWRPPPRHPWPSYAAAGIGLVLLALFAGLLLPLAKARVFGAVAQCPIDPDSLALLSGQSAEAARNSDLQAQLAALLQERGRRQMQCAVPQLPPPAQSQPTPPQSRPPSQAQPTPPHPGPQLPQREWQRHDLSMLDGCWHRYTNMSTHDVNTGQTNPVKEWTVCFDRQGHGQQTVVWGDGVRCQGKLQAQFNADDTLNIHESEPCKAGPPSGRGLIPADWMCRRQSDSEATCSRTELEGPGKGSSHPGQFRR
jgi:hypothetical protein